MPQQAWFRFAFITILVAMFLVSGYFRRKARRTGGVIARSREDRQTIVGRVVVAVPLHASLLAYAINPEWMAWSSVAIPSVLRWAAAAIGVSLLPALWWTMRGIGPNISETYLTKESHELVTRGPYRWVRHPLYSVAGFMLATLSVLAGNWFMLLMTIVAVSAIAIFVIPKEEAALTEKFGEAYRVYREESGRLLPRVGSARANDEREVGFRATKVDM